MDSLNKLIEIANKHYGGHFTLLKFTTNWRCCFGTMWETLQHSEYMAEGKTMEEAIDNCIANNINNVDIHHQYEKDIKQSCKYKALL